MLRKNLGLAIILLVWIILLLEPAQLLANNEHASLQADHYLSRVENSGQVVTYLSNAKNPEQAEMNYINITVIVPLLQRSSLFSLSKRLAIRILITVNVKQTVLGSYSLDTPVTNVINCPQTIQHGIYRLGGTTNRMKFIIPHSLKNFTMELSSDTSIWMIFYRSYVILVPFEISCSIPVLMSYELRVILLPKNKFLSGYPSIEGLPDLAASNSLEQDRTGQTIFKVNGIFPPIKVAWESKNWERNALMSTGILVAILILLFLTPGQLKRRSRFQKISSGLGKVIAVKNKIVEPIVNRSTKNTHVKLLLTFSIIMISIPVAVGEDPRTNILVLASMPVEIEMEQIAAEISDIIKIYTIADERNDLPTISRLRFFDAVIIGDYDLQIIPMGSHPFEVQAMEFIHNKIVLDQYKSYKLAKWVLETYKNAILVRGQAELSREIKRLEVQNDALLGWDRYIRIIQIEAVLSLLVMMLLVTSIIAYLMENNDEDLQTNLARTIIITIFTFSFLQSLFFAVSRLLVPLSTHAGGSGITAISFIGPFGGGSMPRMASAMFGFIFAFASAGKKYEIEISWKVFLSLVVTGLALIVDPLTGGRFVWTFLLDMTGGADLRGGAMQIQTQTSILSSLIGYIADVLGSNVLGFYRSRGLMLFFAGVTPLLVLGRARKYTTTALIFVCAIMTGWGAMRVGQMIPSTFFASMIPGIFFGILFTLPFLVFSIAEEKIGDRFRIKLF
ncbi:MAG: hypothetical protein ACFFCW_05845 [Candidatus Hodarchaeota archaeon]